MLAWFACVLIGATELLNPTAATLTPQRLVSLAPAATEIVFALGAGDRLVGVTRYDTYPPEVKALPKVGGLFDPDAEAVATLHPTLVIALPAARERAKHFGQPGPAVLVAPAQTLDDMWELITTLGRLLHREAAAAALTTRLRGALATLQSEAKRAAAKPQRVLLVVGHRPWVAAGPGSFLDTLLPMVGAVNAVERGGHYPVLDAEAILAAQPEVVVNLMDKPFEAPWGGHPVRIINADDEALMLPGPRLPDALRRLADRLQAIPSGSGSSGSRP